MDAPAVGVPELDRMVAAAGEANRRVMEELLQQLSNPSGLEWAGYYREIAEAAARDVPKWQGLQQQYYQQQLELFSRTLARNADPAAPGVKPLVPDDRRFAGQEWRDYPLFDYLRQSYQLTSDWLLNAVGQLELDDEKRKRLSFYTRQYLDAVSPSNFPATNPEVLKLALESGGENFAAGLKNLLEDLDKGRVSMTDESVFEVGRNIAITPGSVVFENAMFQLIQYLPTTDKVAARPLLMVPPCINKYYIMDLEPENSLVRHAIDAGHTVFLVSWRNIGPSLATTGFDDYIEKGVAVAIEQTRAICGSARIDTLGFCIGGTLLAMTLAVLAARGEKPAATMTLMTTLLDFSDVGDIRVYLDEGFVAQRERKYADGGIVSGRDLSMAFSSLRANDLIWSYVVNNYLKGRTPEPFNLLYWNSDSTNLPGPMYAWYVRNLYLENRLPEPGALSIGGTPVDLTAIDCPSFVFAAREDHIVPWRTAFDSAGLLAGEVEFVLGASGHIAGAINPAKKNKRNYWTGAFHGRLADEWLDQAESRPGSWWTAWTEWLDRQQGRSRKVAARRKPGDARHPPIEDAPGRYVRVRSEQAD